MMDSNLKFEINARVKNKIRDILCESDAVIHDTDHLVYDLKICSDDISFTFIDELEEELSVYGTQDEWLAVYTVGDAIDLLYSLKVAGRSKPPSENSFWRFWKRRFKK